MLTLAWDIDDVLNDFMRAWLEDFRPAFPYKDVIENPPHRILGITLQEYLSSIDHFRLSNKAIHLKPNEEILSWFEEKGDQFRHIALTATPLQTSPVSAYWLTKNFGKWIQSFNFVPSLRMGENRPIYDKNKKEFLERVRNIDILIDDDIKNINGAESVGVMGILISRPWNTEGYSIKETLNLLEAINKND